jgi:hypothetical protein
MVLPKIAHRFSPALPPTRCKFEEVAAALARRAVARVVA